MWLLFYYYYYLSCFLLGLLNFLYLFPYFLNYYAVTVCFLLALIIVIHLSVICLVSFLNFFQGLGLLSFSCSSRYLQILIIDVWLVYSAGCLSYTFYYGQKTSMVVFSRLWITMVDIIQIVRVLMRFRKKVWWFFFLLRILDYKDVNFKNVNVWVICFLLCLFIPPIVSRLRWRGTGMRSGVTVQTDL